MRHVVALALISAVAAVPCTAQHMGGGSGEHASGGGGHAAGMSRSGGLQRGTRQHYGGTHRPQINGMPAARYGSNFAAGNPGNRPMFNARRDPDDGGRRYGRDGYGYGYGFGRYGRGWGGYPYGYGYPFLYSGLTYGGDLGYGDGFGDGSGSQGANGDDANDSGYNSEQQGDGGQPPIPYNDGGTYDQGPAGYESPAGPNGGVAYGSGPGYSSPGGYQEGPGSSGYAGGGGYAVYPRYPSRSSISSAENTGDTGQGDGVATGQSASPRLYVPAAVTLVFKDGRAPETIHNYALTRTTLYVTDAKPQEIPVADLDLAATEKANRDAGVKFSLPQ